MYTLACLWLWSVEQAAYLRISKPVNHCIIPHISAEDDGLACLPKQEIKETNALEQNGSALNSQMHLNSHCETLVPHGLGQFSWESQKQWGLASLSTEGDNR